MDGHSNDGDRLLNAKEAATYLSLAEGTVRNKASSGEIPFVKVGAALRFWRSELRAWVNEQNAPRRTPEEQEAWEGVRAEEVAKRRAG